MDNMYNHLQDDDEFLDWNDDNRWSCNCKQLDFPCLYQFEIDEINANINILEMLVNFSIFIILFIGTCVIFYTITYNLITAFVWTICIFILAIFTIKLLLHS